MNQNTKINILTTEEYSSLETNLGPRIMYVDLFTEDYLNGIRCIYHLNNNGIFEYSVLASDARSLLENTLIPGGGVSKNDVRIKKAIKILNSLEVNND